MVAVRPPIVGVITQVPAFGFMAGLVVVALLENAAAPETTEAVSVLTKPVIVAVNVGETAP